MEGQKLAGKSGAHSPKNRRNSKPEFYQILGHPDTLPARKTRAEKSRFLREKRHVLDRDAGFVQIAKNAGLQSARFRDRDECMKKLLARKNARGVLRAAGMKRCGNPRQMLFEERAIYSRL